MSDIWIPKRWGGERIIVNNNQYCGKILVFMKSLACSLHAHKVKHETFYVARGKVEIKYSDNFQDVLNDITVYDTNFAVSKLYVCTLEKGDTFTVPVGRVHSMKGLEDGSELYEFSTYDDPVDSYRLLDSSTMTGI